MCAINTAGLSGGQRKLLIFELVCQRTKAQSDLLLVFDEPFAGVTDDFVPFVVERLNELRKRHNILLVTNDHLKTLKELANNAIVVSAMDRSKVQVNALSRVDRDKAIRALSVGKDYVGSSSLADLSFFYSVEVATSQSLLIATMCAIGGYALFLLTFWGSKVESGALMIFASAEISVLSINSFLFTLVGWRDCVREEAEALLHSSVASNTSLKCAVSMALLVFVSILQWWALVTVVDGFDQFTFWIYILVDNAYSAFPFIYLGLYTSVSMVSVEVIGLIPFVAGILFSTALSPGSGVDGLKHLRYLFPR
jgi:energy-coupling factor transporter ATP-binding protein EcfA2